MTGASAVLVAGGGGSIASGAVVALRAGDLDVNVQAAWPWREAHPYGYRKVEA